MRTKIVAMILILLSSALALGVQAEWVKYSPDGRFSVLLPHEPTADKAADKDVITYSYMSLEPGIGFAGTYADLPLIVTDLDKFLNEARDGIIKATGPLQGSDQKISLESYPGREFEVTLTLPDRSHMSARIRIYLVGKRLYSLSYISQQDSDAKVNAENMARFFSSFKVISVN
jgi:hypothetical protein